MRNFKIVINEENKENNEVPTSTNAVSFVGTEIYEVPVIDHDILAKKNVLTGTSTDEKLQLTDSKVRVKFDSDLKHFHVNSNVISQEKGSENNEVCYFSRTAHSTWKELYYDLFIIYV